jgi:hypothetical protein
MLNFCYLIAELENLLLFVCLFGFTISLVT